MAIIWVYIHYHKSKDIMSGNHRLRVSHDDQEVEAAQESKPEVFDEPWKSYLDEGLLKLLKLLDIPESETKTQDRIILIAILDGMATADPRYVRNEVSNFHGVRVDTPLYIDSTLASPRSIGHIDLYDKRRSRLGGRMGFFYFKATTGGRV